MNREPSDFDWSLFIRQEITKTVIVLILIGIFGFLVTNVFLQPYISHIDKVVGFAAYKADYLELEPLNPYANVGILNQEAIITSSTYVNLSLVLVNYGDVPLLLRNMQVQSSYPNRTPIFTDFNPILYNEDGNVLTPIRVVMPNEKINAVVRKKEMNKMAGSSSDEMFSFCLQYNPLDKYYKLKDFQELHCTTTTYVKWT